MHVLTAAIGALDLGFVDVGDVVLLGEFLVAVFAMIGVLRHGVSPGNIIAPIFEEGCEFEGRRRDS
jgi:hypothetical protein